MDIIMDSYGFMEMERKGRKEGRRRETFCMLVCRNAYINILMCAYMMIVVVRKDSGYLKTMRLGEIKREMAKTIANGIDCDRLLDWIEINLGLKRETAKDYVALIMRTQGWVTFEGKIVADIEAV